MFENLDIQKICNLIILFGSAYFMIIKMIDSWAKPTSKFKQKKRMREKNKLKNVLDDVMPKYLEEHDLKIRDRYRADRQKYLNEIKDEVLKEAKNTLEEIKKINTEQNGQLEHLDGMMGHLHQGQKDILRQKIMYIYNMHKKDKILSFDERDSLDALYNDYKAINGNSYIDRVYNRAIRWKVTEDDYLE